MATTPEEALGKLVFARTPYDKLELPSGWDTLLEQDMDTAQWYFRGQTRQVGKALRIPVTVTRIVEHEDVNGTSTYSEEKFRDYLLIGYEGAGGY
jgi:hypothetical protein